ncbi:MAG: PD-(D/E)XK nuclease family protein [bacterium]|nr:PD-(D/E)XK nuclease family protein [bacterium]
MIEVPITEIASGTPFITSNRRLSTYVRSQYDMAMQERGGLVWNSPTLIPWLAWLEKMRAETRPDRPIMSELAALSLWEEVLRNDLLFKKGEVLVEGGVIKSAYDAYDLIKEYRLTLPDDDIYSSPEVSALTRWIRSYSEKVADLGFEERLNLPDEITFFIDKGEIKPGKRLILAGFDELTPQQSGVVRALEEKGCQVKFWPSKPKIDISASAGLRLPQSVKLELFENELEEVIYTARWIRKIYRPGMRIGIIVPALNLYKDMINRELAAELAPSSVMPSRSNNKLINVSLGESLFDSPIVRYALNVLSLDGRRHELELISSILLSPFAGKSGPEKLHLAKIDSALKKESHLLLSISELKSMVEFDSAPYMFTLLEEAEKINQEDRQRRFPGSWSKEFDIFLKRFVQPVQGDELSGVEYQALGALGEVLSSFASLDDITGPIDRNEALMRIKKIIRDKIHQPETDESPIQVMGLLESSGLSFDHIRLIGAHDKVLPGDPAPNPFLPLHIQKKYQLPRSSYDRELAFASVQLNRIIGASSNFSVSAPKSLNNVAVNISPMFFGSEIISGKREEEKSVRQIDLIHDIGRLEPLQKETNIPLLKDELLSLRGGSSILKNQSDCPFRAFAIHRLYSSGIDEPEAGMTSMERGNIVHKVMELFWEKTKDSKELQKMINEGSLDEAIADAVTAGLKQAAPARKLGKRYMDIELTRLISLVREWLEIEAERDEFSAITREFEKEITVAGLPLLARIDRIDELGEGAKALIDYKTGASGPNDWLTKRPKEPQLMLYAMSGDFDAVSFAKLKRGESGFAGIAKEEGILPRVKAFGSEPFSKKLEGVEGWDQLINEWRNTVEGLGKSFMEGEADVDPRGYGKEDSACRYCDQVPLCRLFEASC